MDLHRYLNAQAASGEQISEGEFTVAWAKQREKLREFQLANPAFYLLKLVQAAVSSQAQAVKIWLGASTVRVEFEGSSELLGPEVVVQALTRLKPTQDRGLHHLLVALNASLACGVETLWGSSLGQALKLTADSTELLDNWEPPGQYSERPRLIFHLQKTTRDHSAEREALNTRCGSGLTPILVDNHPLLPKWPPVEGAAWHLNFAQPYYLGKRFLCREPSPLRFPRVNIQGRKPDQKTWVKDPQASSLDTTFAIAWSEPEWAFSNLEQGLLCAGGFALPLALEGPSHIYFIKDGVRLEPWRVPGCDFGGVAVLPGDDVKVDIGEFGVLLDQDLGAQVAVVKAQWSELIGYLLERVEQLPAPLVGSQSMEGWGGLAMLPGLDLLYLLVSAFTFLIPGEKDGEQLGRFQATVRHRLEQALRSCSD